MTKLPEHVRRFRLGVFANDPANGRSLSRLLGPFNAMMRQDPRLEIVRPERTRDNTGWDMDWHYFSSLDAMYFLDPYQPSDLAQIALARATGCRVWVDYIDDLLAVPPSNPAWGAYADRAGVLKIMTECLKAADIGTATTETLKYRLPVPERVLVLPESCRWPQCPVPRQRVVSWRGLGSHAEDLELVLPQLREVSHLPQFSLWQWVFFGEPPWRLFQDIIPKDRLILEPPNSAFDWMNRWGTYAPYIHIAPLANTRFNQSKTPLVWLEATAIGAAVIGPELQEWKDCRGLLRYRDAADFGTVLRREMETFTPLGDGKQQSSAEGQFHPAAHTSRADVYPARTLEAVNELRWLILGRLARPAAVVVSKPEESGVAA